MVYSKAHKSCESCQEAKAAAAHDPSLEDRRQFILLRLLFCKYFHTFFILWGVD